MLYISDSSHGCLSTRICMPFGWHWLQNFGAVVAIVNSTREGLPRGFSSKVYVGAERLSLQSLNIRWWRKQIGFVGQDWGLDIFLTSLIGSMYGIFTYLYHKNPNTPYRYNTWILWFWGGSWLRMPIYVGGSYTSCTHCHSPLWLSKTTSCRCWKDGNLRNHDGVSLIMNLCIFASLSQRGKTPKLVFKGGTSNCFA